MQRFFITHSSSEDFAFMKITDNAKKGITVALVTCAIVFVVLFALVNIGAVSAVFSSVLSVFTPVIIGFAIAYILNPILRLFEFKIFKKVSKKSMLRGLSILCTYIVALLIVIAFFWLIIPSLIEAVMDLVSRYDEYISHTSDIINNVINWFMKSDSVAEYVNDAAIKDIISKFFSFSGDALDSVMKYIVEYGSGLFAGIKNTVIGIFISIYVLISKEKLQAQLRKFGAAVLSDTKQRRLGKYINLTHRNFSGYFVGKILGSCIVFVMIFSLMLVFGMPYPLLISTIIAVTDIIPVFGPFLGAIPSFFIIFIISPSKALLFVVFILLIQQIEGNIISPKILGEATGISSLSVIIAIIVMGDYFGIIGMIIGVPVFAVGITIVKELVETRLKKKGKSTDTADYYLKDSVIDPYDTHETISKRIFNNIEKGFSKIVAVFKNDKNDEATEAEDADGIDTEEKDDSSDADAENINKGE